MDFGFWRSRIESFLLDGQHLPHDPGPADSGQRDLVPASQTTKAVHIMRIDHRDFTAARQFDPVHNSPP